MIPLSTEPDCIEDATGRACLPNPPRRKPVRTNRNAGGSRSRLSRFRKSDTIFGRSVPKVVSPARAAELCSARMSEAGFRIAKATARGRLKRLRSDRHDPAGIA
ncbi:MAG: hypothetical protein PGN34_19010 [Methylobacterium frigidaeris]